MSSRTSFSPAFEAFAADVSAAAIAQRDALNDFLGGDHRSVDLNARTLTGGGRTLTGVTCLGSFSHMDK